MLHTADAQLRIRYNRTEALSLRSRLMGFYDPWWVKESFDFEKWIV